MRSSQKNVVHFYLEKKCYFLIVPSDARDTPLLLRTKSKNGISGVGGVQPPHALGAMSVFRPVRNENMSYIIRQLISNPRDCLLLSRK